VKKKILVLIMVSFVAMSFAQIKNYVGIVRQNLSAETTAYFTEMKDTFTKEGFTQYAESIDYFLEGGFGSGFVYVDKNGNNYVITNLHVVPLVENASIEFEDTQGNVKKYENLKVIYADEKVDLAILAFANNEKPFKEGLKIASKNLTDGQDVWSAGFPALGKEPSWQLGRGIVSNAVAKVKDIIRPEISTVIQHSAQVDSGNSGGPLLLADATVQGGYAVVGVNTAKAIGRQAANFAIPAKTLITFIDNALANKATATEESLVTESKEFAEIFSEKDFDFDNIGLFISNEWILRDGRKAIFNLIDEKASSNKTAIMKIFTNYSVFEGMRYAIALKIWDILNLDKSQEMNCSYKNFKKENNSYKTSFSFEQLKHEIESTWIVENNKWKLSGWQDVSFDKKATSKNKKAAKKGLIVLEDFIAGDFGISHYLNDELKTGMGLNISSSFEYLLYGGELYTLKSKNSVIDGNILNVYCGLMLPLNITNILLVIPDVKAGFGLIGYGSEYMSDMMWSFGFGVTLASQFDLPINLRLRLGYNNFKAVLVDEDAFSASLKQLNLGLGISITL